MPETGGLLTLGVVSLSLERASATRRSLLLALILSLLCASCMVPDGRAEAGSLGGPRSVPRRVWYGNSARSFIDVFAPEGAAKGVLAWVHGGAWMAGTAAWEDIPTVVQEMRERGFVIASIEYDLVPRSTEPSQVKQVLAAVRALRREYRTPVLLGGHSAGAHIAGLAGLSDSSIPAVVLLGSPGNLRDLAETGQSIWGYSLAGLVSAALGCSDVDPHGGNECSEAEMQYGDLTESVRRTKGRAVPAAYIAYGLRDSVVPPAQTGELGRVWEAAVGPKRCWIDVVENAEHSMDGVNDAALELFLKSFSKWARPQ